VSAPKKAAVVGYPVGHSLSPVVWRAAYEQLGLKGWEYETREVDEEGFARLVGHRGEFAGLSVTMPYKHLAARLVDRTVGRTAGAVNTVVFTPDGTEGHNTDVDGVEAAVREVAPDGVGHLVVLGAGGTAAAALLAAQRLHPERVTIVARNAAPANDLRERTGRTAAFEPWTRAREVVATADVVVNATPKGAADELAAGWAGAPLVDVLYDPWPTPLATAARAGGHKVAGGLFVLAHQAVRQVELVTGRAPDAAALLAAAEGSVTAG
jgi:shikimate dehydrogenase